VVENCIEWVLYRLVFRELKLRYKHYITSIDRGILLHLMEVGSSLLISLLDY
jgi:hypothetical protein